MATIATNLTLSKLIAKMREIAKETAESTYALGWTVDVIKHIFQFINTENLQ